MLEYFIAETYKGKDIVPVTTGYVTTNISVAFNSPVLFLLTLRVHQESAVTLLYDFIPRLMEQSLSGLCCPSGRERETFQMTSGLLKLF